MKPFFAIVYELCLDGDGVAKDDPLYETSYIGQSGRYASSPEEALEMRWAKHQSDAKKKSKECGLKWALQKYGPEAFTRRVICFLKFEKRCIEALDYMNAVEIEEIDCRGGVMQDIDPPVPVWQTFNLTNGGQGDPKARFKALQVMAQRVWKRFQEKVLELVAETGTCQCCESYKSRCGYSIGWTLIDIRTRRRFLHNPENVVKRERWLESLPGWYWNFHDDRWECFVAKLQDFVADHGHAEVPCRTELGKVVHSVRNGQMISGHKDEHIRKAFLESLPGWIWSVPDRNFDIFYNEMLCFVKEHGHALVPQNCKLGKKLNKARNGRFRAHQPQNKLKLEALPGWKWNARENLEQSEAEKKAQIRSTEKRKVDLAALRATLVPKARADHISKYRQDGTVAKAHQILRERSVDAGV